MAIEAFGIKINTGGQLIDPNLKLLVYPGLSLVGIIILLIITISTGYSKISTQIEQVGISEKNVNVLKTKAEILREISEGILAHTDTSIIAMPDSNPGLWTLSQIKSLAKENEVEITGLTFGSQNNSGAVGSVNISFSINGGAQQILDYLKDIESLAPVMTLGLVGLTKDGENFSVTSDVTTYWSDLPTQIPPLTQPITKLSKNEEELLVLLARLSRPEFTTLSPSDEPNSRIDPFN